MSDRFRYTADIDIRNANDSHSFAIASVLARSNVLDIGAADGSVARALSQMGCRVWGVEGDPQAAEQATEWCEEVIVGDVEQLDFADTLDMKFDVILFLDILEHLRDPVAVARRALQILDDRGYVVVSLPNVAHGAVRAQLMGGRFAYTDTGLLDRTHLRFFDSVSVREFLDNAGLVVLDEARVSFPIQGTEIPVDMAQLSDDTLNRLRDETESETYQFLFIAAPLGSDAASNPPFLPARILQRELRIMQERFGNHGRGGQVALDDMMGELTSLRSRSAYRRNVLQQLLSTVEQNTKLSLDDHET